jgi:hypothetical protein
MELSKKGKGITRRKFMQGVAAASAFTVIPRQVLGGPGFVAPSDRLNVAQVGAGTQSLRQFTSGVVQRPDIQVRSVVDPNAESQDYLDWGRFGTRRSIRRLLEDDAWAEGDTGTRGGREYSKRIIETYYGKNTPSGTYEGITSYADIREMLATDEDVDTIFMVVPDHLHAALSIEAMKAGKNVIMHKPLGLTPHEVRRVLDVQEETGAVTHMLAYHAPEEFPRLQSWLAGNIVGPIRQVHNWTNRPVWPQGWSDYPEPMPIPEGFDWQLWQGPLPDQPYHVRLTHTTYRGWYNYGAGCLGDMGNYSLWQPHRFLNLDAPTMVEAYTNKSVTTDGMVCMSQDCSPVSYPAASQIHMRHPANADRPEVDVFWYSGAMKPPTPEELVADGETLPGEGMLFVGDYGKILCGFRGHGARLLPESRMQALGVPEEERPDVETDDEWADAAKNGGRSRGSFQDAESLAMSVAVAIIALKNPGERLFWDNANMRFTNSEAANQMVRREYRDGWQI